MAEHPNVARIRDALAPVRELARVRVIESTFDDVGRERLVELARRVGT
jgi:hypothetical protein